MQQLVFQKIKDKNIGRNFKQDIISCNQQSWACSLQETQILQIEYR